MPAMLGNGPGVTLLKRDARGSVVHRKIARQLEDRGLARAVVDRIRLLCGA